MKTVIQRVKNASVSVNGVEIGKIDQGLLILLGIETADSEEDVDWLTKKIAQLRVFNDSDGLPNLNVNQIKGNVLVVSQFTLHAKTKKGNRPSYIRAAHPDIAMPLYECFKLRMNELVDNSICSGEFGANMQVSLINDGPHTLIIDSKNKD